MTPRDDEQLIGACRAGDEAAWSILVDRYAALILSIPRRHGFSAAQADDIFADVCFALVRALPRLRDARALPAWLIRTTTRAMWETARQTKRRKTSELPDIEGGIAPESLVEGLEDEQLVREALRNVSHTCRELLTWLFFSETTPDYDEIAQKMGKPRGSLGPTRRRCLERMRKWLAPRLGGVSSGDEDPL